MSIIREEERERTVEKDFGLFRISGEKASSNRSSESGDGDMAQGSSKSAGRYLALSILIASLIIAIVGFYFVLTSWGHGGDGFFSIALSSLMALVILLIVFMMWKIGMGLKKTPGLRP
jgi:hypothetical protein